MATATAEEPTKTTTVLEATTNANPNFPRADWGRGSDENRILVYFTPGSPDLILQVSEHELQAQWRRMILALEDDVIPRSPSPQERFKLAMEFMASISVDKN